MAAAATAQLCVSLFTQSASVDLHRTEWLLVGDLAACLQPVCTRLSKLQLQGDLDAGADELLASVGAVHEALVQLQSAMSKCAARHWLLRVLVARDARASLQSGLTATHAALERLVAAAAAPLGDDGRRQLEALRDTTEALAGHRVAKHDTLELLCRGLLKHVEKVDDARQLPAMLRFAVKEASHGHVATRVSDGGGSAVARSSGRGRASLPPGEASLSDGSLLVPLELLLTASKQDSPEQMALQQILRVLEELHEAKQTHRRRSHRRHAAQQQPRQALRRVSEADDEDGDALPSDGGRADTRTGRDQAAAAAAAPAGLGGAHGQLACGGGASLEAMMGQLEGMLCVNPHDLVALTQLMELLLQVESAEDAQQRQQQQLAMQQQVQQAPQQQQQPGAGKQEQGSRRWWQVGAAAAAALKGAAKPAAASSMPVAPQLEAEMAEQQQLLSERLHQVASAALDVLLHLTPRPAGTDSCFRPASRDSVCTEAGNSLALPLMQHPDSVQALAACMWSRWPDVACKAAQLLAILVASGPAVVAGEGSQARKAYTAFCQRVGSSSSSSSSGSGSSNGGSAHSIRSRDRIAAAAPHLTVLEEFIAARGEATAQQRQQPQQQQPGGGSSTWFALSHLLHSGHHAAAGAAAEALAAIAASPAMATHVSSLAATQQARALLLLLARYTLHPGAAGAAAAALLSLSRPALRPAMHAILANSYSDSVPGAGQALGELLVALLAGTDALAGRRGAELAAALAPAADWAAAGPGLWLATYRGAQQLLAAASGSSDSGSSATRAAAARLLVQLLAGGGDDSTAAAAAAAAGDDAALAAVLQLQQECGGGALSPLAAAGVAPEQHDELLFESLQLCVQLFAASADWQASLGDDQQQQQQQLCEPLEAARLLAALLAWLPEEACCIPELGSVVLPVVQHLHATRQGPPELHREVAALHARLAQLG